MMWNPFKKLAPEVHVAKTKRIDWSKVKTVEEIVLILSCMPMTKDVNVPECIWNDPLIKHLLGTTITETTYVGGFIDKVEEYDERTD